MAMDDAAKIAQRNLFAVTVFPSHRCQPGGQVRHFKLVRQRNDEVFESHVRSPLTLVLNPLTKIYGAN